MNNLIRTYDDGTQCVCARDLHTAVGNKQDYSSWIKRRIKKYKFLEGSDFRVFTQTSENLQGGRPAKEYYVSMDMAKELCMVESTDRGRQVRQYFIEVEKQWSQGFSFDPDDEKHLELVITGLLNKTYKQLEVIKNQKAQINNQAAQLGECNNRIEVMEKTQSFLDEETFKFRNSFTATHVAKSLNMRSAQELNTWLVDMGVQYRQGNNYYLRAAYVGKGLEYNHLARYDAEGEPALRHQLRWTFNGKAFIHTLYKEWKEKQSTEMVTPDLPLNCIPAQAGGM